MIRLHCDHLNEFLRIYVFDRHVLPALAIPLVFTLLFPLYWFVACPAVWAEWPELLTLTRPRTWLVAYWLVASLVWFVSLAVCLCHMHTLQQGKLGIRGVVLCNGGLSNSSAISRTRHNSTEDLWNEDQYLPDPPYLPSPPDIRVSVTGIQPRQSSCNMDEPKREMDETWDYNYEEQSQASDSPFVVNPCHDVTESWSPGSCSSSSNRGEQRQLRIYHSNLMRTTADFPPPDGRGNSLPASPFCSGSSPAGASFTFPVMSETTSSSCRGSTAAPAGASPPRRLSGTLPANHRSYRRFFSPSSRRGGSLQNLRNSSPSKVVRRPPPSFGGGGGLPQRPLSRHAPPPPPARHLHRRYPLQSSSLSRLNSHPPAARGHHPPPTASAPRLTTTDGSLSEAEMRSIRDVCTGKIERKDSIVSDAKFDTLIASLQSLASEIEKDFVEQNLTDFAAERAAHVQSKNSISPSCNSSSSSKEIPSINIEEHVSN